MNLSTGCAPQARSTQARRTPCSLNGRGGSRPCVRRGIPKPSRSPAGRIPSRIRPLEMAMLRPSIDEVPDDLSETATVNVEAKQASEFDDSYSHDRNEVELATERGSEGWNLKVSALALGGIVMIGALFDLAQAPPDDTYSTGAFASAAASAAQPPSGISGGTPVAATVNRPIVAALIAAPSPASQIPDPKTVPAISLRPDGTPIATWPPSATDSSVAAQTSDAARPAAKPPPKVANETAGSAQPSTPKLDFPKKRSGKFSNRVVVARVDTTAPATAAETPGQPVQLGTPVKAEKAARAAPKAPQAAAEPPASAQQPVNALARAFGELVGAPPVPAASAQQRVEFERRHSVERLGRSTGRAKIGDRSQERRRAVHREICVRAQRRGDRRA